MWVVKEKQNAQVPADGCFTTQVKNTRPAEKVSKTSGHGEEGKSKTEQGGVKSKKIWVVKEKQTAQVSGNGFTQAKKNARRTEDKPRINKQDPKPGLQGAKFVSQSEEEEEEGLKGNKKAEARAEESNPVGAAASDDGAVKETCEKWRLRGNQDYANGYFSKAEVYYTHGVNCVSPNETSRSCMRALMLCYSNRAVTRMSLGRMREALSDCFMALAIDPGFLKAQVRAGICHLILGEAEDATKFFKKCLQQGNDVSLDQKILSKASDDLQKAKKVADYMDRAAELLRSRNSDYTKNALEIVSEALSISPLSESLNEMKAEALLMLRSYEEVVQLCERTLDYAEKNIVSVNDDNKVRNVDGSESTQGSPARLWRWRLISKSYFYLGRLEEAINLLEKHEKVGPVIEKYGNKSLGSPAPFSAVMRELLRLKALGNEAFQAGRHLEAVEHYTAVLACNVESRPFAAICFCNRAAAYQALGQMTEAIADCSLAIALDTNYPKAISRRATLYEMIRDYGQAITDLHRLISLLEQQTEDKISQSGVLGRSTSSRNDLKRARHRLAIIEEEGKKGIPLDMYLILGIESSSTAEDIKKAYRKAALRHHPDKAGHLLARSENRDGLWREVADEVHKDADMLFKMIREAYISILKALGNEAFQAGRHLEAVEHYTAVLACNVESRPFAAICFCNRAAAYQALGQMTEAIADCSLAIALDTNYPKAISRRATLLEMIRDYGQAITDLHRLISLLEQQAKDKISQSGALGRSTSSGNDLMQARHRLDIVEEEGKKEIPLDMYLILGIESSSTAADIKKAYRKAALRHHPDKAGHLARSENHDGHWREVSDEVHRDADILFKMIGEAYTVLSDTTKRLQYDTKEEMRNIYKR